MIAQWRCNYVVLLSLWLQALARIAPECKFDGKEYDGSNGEEISAVCNNTLGGDLSFAWTVTPRVSGHKNRILDVKQPGEKPAVMAAIASSDRLAFLYIPVGTGEEWMSTPNDFFTLDTEYRCLVTLTSAGFAELWVDGVKVVDKQFSAGLPQQARELWVGRSAEGGYTLTALVEDVWIWHEIVPWADAETHWTTTTTTATATTTTATLTTATSTVTTATTTTTATATTATTTTSTATTTTTFTTTTTATTFTATTSTSSSASSTTTASTTATVTDTTTSTTPATSSTAVWPTTTFVDTSTMGPTTTVGPTTTTGASSPSASSASSTTAAFLASSNGPSLTSGVADTGSSSAWPLNVVSSTTQADITTSARATSATGSTTLMGQATGSTTLMGQAMSATGSTTLMRAVASSSTAGVPLLPTEVATTTTTLSATLSTAASTTTASKATTTVITTTTHKTTSLGTVVTTEMTSRSRTTTSRSLTVTTATATSTETSATTPNSLSTTQASLPDVLVNSVQAEASKLLVQLSNSNTTQLTTTNEAGMLVTVARLPALAPDPTTDNGTQFQSVTVPLPTVAGEAREMDVRFPSGLLAALTSGLPEGEALGVVLALPPEAKSLGGPGVEVQSAVVIEVSTLAGAGVDISGLQKPIEFSLPVQNTAGLLCMFWDADLGQWSSEGVATLGQNSAGDLLCSTSHLSLFGAIIQGFTDAFLCSNFQLLNAEGVGELFKGEWLATLGSALFFGLLGLTMLTMLVAACLDWNRKQRPWSMEFFLVPLGPAPARASEQSADDSDNFMTLEVDELLDDAIEDENPRLNKLKEMGGVCCCIASCLGCCIGICRCCRESALRDAVDEVLESYVDSFSDIRGVLEGIWEGLEISALGAGRMLRLFQSVMSQLLITSSRYLVGATLGVSGDCVTFVLEDPVIGEMIRKAQQRRASQQSARESARLSLEQVPFEERTTVGSSVTYVSASAPTVEPLDWRTCKRREDAWASLHDEITDNMDVYVSQHSWFYLPKMTWQIFRIYNTFGNVCSNSIFTTCKTRALYHMLQLVGDLMVVCIFFASSGGMKGKSKGGGDSSSACGGDDELEEEMTYKLGRIVAIALGSVLIAGLPVSLLKSLQTRKFKKLKYEGCKKWKKQLRAWRMQDRMVWVLGISYLLFALFFIGLFIANTGAEDHVEWTSAGAISVVQDAVMLPFAVAFAMPTLATLFFSGVSFAGGIQRNTLVADVRSTLRNRSTVRGSNTDVPVLNAIYDI